METPLRLTAIILLLRPMGPWYVRPVLLALAASVLLWPRALQTPAVWAAVTTAIALAIASDWPLADNHIYLLAYWTLGIALALRSTGAAESLAIVSRRLIGLSFALAVLWKAVLSPDFLDGRFFRVTLLTDPRFTEATMLMTGLSAEDLDRNREMLDVLPDGAVLLDPPKLVEPTRLRAFAAVSTWGILALEALVACVMLMPRFPWVVPVRHTALIAFCAVTYAFAPVSTFGWILLAMGMAQTGPAEIWRRRLYAAASLAVLLYGEVPWTSMLLSMH
jgi:hypothetical protein